MPSPGETDDTTPLFAAVSTLLVLVLGCALTGCSPTPQTADAAVATADTPVTHAENDRVPEGAAWTQHYFPSSDGSDVELHADVLENRKPTRACVVGMGRNLLALGRA